MKVLVVFSNPPGQTRLRLDKEDKAISNIARKHSQTATVERLHASEIEDIHSLLINGAFNTIHFSGHGSPDGIFLDQGDLSPEGELVSPRRFVEMVNLADRPLPDLVILLSCYSDAQVDLLANAAPFVITAKWDVPDEACITFSRGFYERYLGGYSIQQSFDHARHLLAVARLCPDCFRLSRRALIRKGNSILVEVKPFLDHDSILVSLDAVRQSLGSFGMSEESLLHLMARKLRIHTWLFDRPRDTATIPIGQLLFGEFSWQNSKDFVECRRLLKLRADVPYKQWEIWAHLLTEYNDLASLEHRFQSRPPDPRNRSLLAKSVHRFRLSMDRDLLPAKERIIEVGCGHVLPHVVFAAREVDRAAENLKAQNYDIVVEALEGALTSYHEVVDGLQPPAEKDSSNPEG